LVQVYRTDLFIWVKVVSINKIVNRNHALGITNNRKASGSVIRYISNLIGTFLIVLFFEKKKLCNPKCNHNMNWYFFRTCVLCFFHLSLVKTIVKSAKYPVYNMPSLWKTITLFDKDEVPEIIMHSLYHFTLVAVKECSVTKTW
jgi:hypothetical protein